jgi:hypothetical protein
MANCDTSLVSICIEKDVDLEAELEILEKEKPTKKNREKLDNLLISMTLYSNTQREQSRNENTPSIFSEDFDKAYNQHKERNSKKSFRIDSHKPTSGHQMLDNTKSSIALSFKENCNPLSFVKLKEVKATSRSPLLEVKKNLPPQLVPSSKPLQYGNFLAEQSNCQAAASTKKKSFFTVKPSADGSQAQLKKGVTPYSASNTPLLEGLKEFHKNVFGGHSPQLKVSSMLPSPPGSVTRKKFFINPRPAKSRILDF